MPKVCGYCRLSKDELTETCLQCKEEFVIELKDTEQTEYDCPACGKTLKLNQTNPVSIQSQTDKIMFLGNTKVPRNVDPNIKIVADVNVSGSVPIRDRPQGALIMAELRDGDYLIAAKLDRLFRDLEDCVRQIKFFRTSGIKLILGDFPDLDINSPVGEMVLQILAVFAEFERKRIAERTKEGLRKRKEMGLPVGSRPPLGSSLMCVRCEWVYSDAQALKGKFCPHCKCARNGNTRFTPNQAEHTLMWRLLWHRSSYHWLEWDLIVHNINTEGLRTREGNKWSRQALGKYYDAGVELLWKGQLLESCRPAKMENFSIHNVPHIPKKVAELLEQKSREHSIANA